MTVKHLSGLRREFEKLKCLVIGTIALDINKVGRYGHWLSREIEGLPIFRYNDTIYNAGGGGNLLFNLANQRIECHACGIWGRDYDHIHLDVLNTDWNRVILQRLLTNKNIEIKGMVETKQPTPVFEKYYNPHGHHMMRIDSRSTAITGETEKQLLENIAEIAPKCDFIIVADYNEEGFGVCTPAILTFVSGLEKPTFGTSRERISIFEDFDYLIFNERDLIEGMKGRDFPKYFFPEPISGIAFEGDAIIIDLLMATHAEFAILTKGEEGVVLYSRSVKSDKVLDTVKVKTKSMEGIINPCGAGDTFLAFFAASIAAGLEQREALRLGIASARATLTNLFSTGYPNLGDVSKEYKEIYGEKQYMQLLTKWGD